MAIQARAVLVYNKRDNFYKIYASVSHAMREVGAGIRSVLYGSTTEYKGYTIKYFDEATEDEMLLAVPVSTGKSGVEIYSGVYDLPIRRFATIEDARRYLEAYYRVSLDHSNILACANGRRKHAGVIKVNGNRVRLKWRWIPQDVSAELSIYDYDFAPAGYMLGDYLNTTTRHHDEKPWRA